MRYTIERLDPWWYMPDGCYHRFYDGQWHIRLPWQMSDDEKLAAVHWNTN